LVSENGLGLETGDRVGIYSPNMAEWTLLQFACARVGVILVNLNPAFGPNDLNYSLNKVGVKVLIMAESFKKSQYVDILRKTVPEL
jgi:fatty-acyl-CoA synthase